MDRTPSRPGVALQEHALRRLDAPGSGCADACRGGDPAQRTGGRGGGPRKGGPRGFAGAYVLLPGAPREGAVAAAGRPGASMVNVHISGGDEMMRAAAEARGADAYVIGVTVLTSAEGDVSRIVEMARSAREAGLDGVV